MNALTKFDKAAATWDEEPRRIEMARRIAAALQEQVPLQPDMDVLDFGCGTGLLSLQMAGRVASLCGVDTSAGMLDVFKQKAASLDLSNVNALQLDLDQGSEIPGAYDLVVSSMVFHHIENIEAVLARLFAVLKPGGAICIADLDAEDGSFHGDMTGVFHHGFDRAAFLLSMERSGFVNCCSGLATEVIRGEQRFGIFWAAGRKR